jgi:hypothetical protein
LKKKLRTLFLVCIAFFCLFSFSSSTPVFADQFNGNEGIIGDEQQQKEREQDLDVQKQVPTDDTDTIYSRYKDNSFTLMNKEYSSLNKINEFLQNIGSWVKNIVGSLVTMTGKFNTFIVHTLFSINIAEKVKEPFQKLSIEIAKNLNSVAVNIGLAIVACLILAKFVTTGRVKESAKVFGLALLTMVCFSLFINESSNKYFFDTLLEIDNQLELAIADVNPEFSEEEQTTIPENALPLEGNRPETDSTQSVTVAEKIRSKVFRANVYEPYLYLNYGTTDSEKIREKQIEYKGESYDRIGALLDNDNGTDKQIKFVDAVTDYEVDTIGNSMPSYLNGNQLTGIAGFYFVSNIIQMFIFAILGLVRLALQILLITLPPFLPFFLFFGMISPGSGVLMGYLKGVGTVSFLKATISLITIIFTSYISIGYKIIEDEDEPFVAIITLIAWIVAPVAIYYFRYFLAGIFSKRMRMMSGGLMFAGMHPGKAAKQARNTRQEEKKQREAERKKKQKELEEKKKQNTKDGNPNAKNELNNPKSNKQNPNNGRKNRVTRKDKNKENSTEETSMNNETQEQQNGQKLNETNQADQERNARKERVRVQKQVSENGEDGQDGQSGTKIDNPVQGETTSHDSSKVRQNVRRKDSQTSSSDKDTTSKQVNQPKQKGAGNAKSQNNTRSDRTSTASKTDPNAQTTQSLNQKQQPNGKTGQSVRKDRTRTDKNSKSNGQVKKSSEGSTNQSVQGDKNTIRNHTKAKARIKTANARQTPTGQQINTKTNEVIHTNSGKIVDSETGEIIQRKSRVRKIVQPNKNKKGE